MQYIPLYSWSYYNVNKLKMDQVYTFVYHLLHPSGALISQHLTAAALAPVLTVLKTD